MRIGDELQVCDQVFHGAFERGEYEKALASVIQCRHLAATIFHSDLCDGLTFCRFHDRWEYYREMEREVRAILRQSRRGQRGGFLSRLFG